jgi:hypothetical protein
MPMEEKVKDRIKELISEGVGLSRGNEYGLARSDDHVSSCKGWLAAASNAVQLVCGDTNSQYMSQFQKILDYHSRDSIPNGVGDGKAILEAILIDIDRGLLSSVADMARAETFDNFLDHAKAYHADGLKQESGVIAGVVFEDTIRRVCEKNNIEQSGVKLDSLISELAKNAIISQTKAKRARVAAHVRTKATHAQWDEFELSDVAVTIEFTEELIVNHVDT